MFGKNKKTEKKLAEMHNLLINSFGNVKDDTSRIFQWIDYLQKENLRKDEVIAELQNQFQNIPVTKEQVKEIIDKHYSYDHIIERIKELHKKINELSFKHETSPDSEKINEIESRLNSIALRQKPVLTEINNLDLRISSIEQKSPKTSFKDRIIRKITKNQKDYVKSLMLSLIKKYERISALQLREIVVEEQGLCSKSSFYRLIAELEENEELVAVQEGKEKYYLSKAVNLNSNR